MNNCAEISSNCVTWEGSDIPCLGIKNGDSLSTLVTIIATKVCELAEPLDLSTLSLQGLLDICGQTEPINITIQTVLQLMIDNNVCLKELIDDINQRLNDIESGDTLTLNLSCLGSEDEFGNEVEIAENDLLQILINSICDLKESISSINLKITDLQEQINAIEINPVITEPDIATCLESDELPTSEQIVIVADEICSVREDLGSTANVQNALSKQTAELDAIYITNPDWILTASVTNLTKLINNLAVIALGHEERITNIENNCCALDCDDVKIGFSVTPNATYNGLIINFGNINGTYIPTGFSDCGSKVTIIDVNGDKVGPYALTIVNDDVEDGPYIVELNVSALQLDENLTINVESRMCNGSLVCVKCTSKQFSFFNSGCPACGIENANEEGVVVVTYTLPGDETEYTETIPAGLTGYINRFATVTEVTLDAVVVTKELSGAISDCFGFPDTPPEEVIT
jgi:hypothetical protein